MKKTTRIVCALTLLFTVCLGTTLRAEQQTWTSDQQAVIDALKNGPIGIEKNFDRWADGYASHWSYWRVGDRTVRPKDEHMALVRAYIDAGNKPVSFELEPIDVIVRGDAAMVRLIATETLLSADGEARIVRYASATMLSRETGDWKVLASNLVYLDDD
ncbi:MAG: nuclear transport factor 2 family protein [Pseudomonadota bacterium]